MKTFEVQIPFTGYVVLTVEAKDEEEAMEKGFKEAEKTSIFNHMAKGTAEQYDLVQDVSDADVSEITATELEDDEEEFEAIDEDYEEDEDGDDE